MNMPLWLTSLFKSKYIAGGSYAKALIPTDAQRLLRKLTALLWAGVALSCGAAWQAWSALLARLDINFPVRPAQRFPDAQPPDTLAKNQPHPQPANHLPSLFEIKPIEKSSLPLLQEALVQVERRSQEQSNIQSARRQWTIGFQRLSTVDTMLNNELWLAQQNLRLGNFDEARLSFEQVLHMDPHQVVALAGMLVVTSQRGELQLREEYLSRIRLEIPGYTPDDDMFLLTGEE